MILVTFRTVALGAALTTVTEWRSQDFTISAGSKSSCSALLVLRFTAA